MNHGGEKPMGQSVLFSLLKLAFGPVVHSTWVGNVTGLEHLPKVGPAIIASNHASYLDFLLLSAVSPRQVQFMAGEVFYNNLLIKKSFESMGYIHVDRGAKSNVSALRKAVRKLEQGNIVAIYPEGRRSGGRRVAASAQRGWLPGDRDRDTGYSRFPQWDFPGMAPAQQVTHPAQMYDPDR